MDSQDTIKRLEECLTASCMGFRTCPYSADEWDAVRSALELIKSQKEEIEELKAEVEEVRSRDVEAFGDFAYKQNFAQKISDELLFHINMQIDFFKQSGGYNG